MPLKTFSGQEGKQPTHERTLIVLTTPQCLNSGGSTFEIELRKPLERLVP